MSLILWLSPVWTSGSRHTGLVALPHKNIQQVVKKHQKDISDIDQKIISIYAKGMTTRRISETIKDIYGFETSEGCFYSFKQYAKIPYP